MAHDVQQTESIEVHMKPYITTLLLILMLPLVLHAAPDYTITNKHRVIQEVSLNQNRVPIGTQLSRLNFTTLDGDTHTLDTLTEQGPRRLSIPRNRMPCCTTLRDASETATHRIHDRKAHYLRRCLRQRNRCRRGY